MIDFQLYKKEHPSFTRYDDWQSLLLPLAELDINYFTYNRIDQNNMRTFLGGNPKVTEICFRDRIASKAIFQQKVTQDEQIILLDKVKHRDESLAAYRMLPAHQHFNTFCIMQKRDDVRHYYTFCSAQASSSIINRYLWSLSTFKAFIHRFHDTKKLRSFLLLVRARFVSTLEKTGCVTLFQLGSFHQQKVDYIKQTIAVG